MSSELYNAIEAKNLELIQSLVNEGVDVNQVDEDGSTPLHAALREYSIETIELLLKNKANLDQVIKGKYTLLYVACFQGQIDIVRLLLKKGANVSLTDKNGLTPFHVAHENGHIDIEKQLIEAMLLKNPNEDKPDFIEKHDILSEYWIKQKEVSLKTIYFSQELGNTLKETILDKISSGKNDTLVSNSFHQFFKSLNPKAIENMISKTDQVNTTPHKLG